MQPKFPSQFQLDRTSFHSNQDVNPNGLYATNGQI
jgi:hypothetical protein